MVNEQTIERLKQMQLDTMAENLKTQESDKASGAGKTYLGCAFGISACRNFLRVKYVRLPELLNELAVARGTGAYQKIMRQCKRADLLILDEWLLLRVRNP